MKINNENEKYTLHFVLSHKYSTYQIFMDTSNEKYQNNVSTYEETRNMIHDYISRTIYLSIYIYIYIYILMISFNTYESNRI